VNNNSKSSGCAVLLVGLFIIGLVLWGIAIALQVLGVVLLIAGPVVGLLVAAYGWRGVLQRKKNQQRIDVLQDMAADARRDLNDIHLELDFLSMTQGIGADLSEADQAELARLKLKASSAKELLNAAPTPQNLREALHQAEDVRLRSHRLIPRK
jgi:hypothetical protein